MNTLQKLTRLLVYNLLFVFTVSAAVNWTFLDVQRMGAQKFIKAHPQYNGKDVVVIILDTGVDMGVPGLTELPDGGVKVIDAQDFSGEGDVFLEEAKSGEEGDEKYLTDGDGLRLYGYDKLKYLAKDSLYYIGVFDEQRFKNSSTPDINNNDKRDDRFGLIVLETEDGWLAYVDLDGDGNLDDEQPLWNYKEKLQSFAFRGRDPKHNKNLLTFALNIFPEDKKVNFHFDGASHGTHVAGITAGYRINGREGFNGVAPGAKIISLKIGDCRLAGGATTTGSMLEAYEYGVEFAKKHDGPVVFNMSFGIGSEIEGQSDMDLMLDDMLAENEKLLFCISAGNEGPGISTIGLPAAAKRVLTVGALNTKEMARDLYGAKMKEDKLFVFSSRGGEVNKPDIVTPGGASSTVPPYNSGDSKWGTSMASPQATGAVALIMSAAYQQNPPLPINGAIIKKAVKNAARPLTAYLPLEQGSGVIDIPRAFEYYKEYIKDKEQEKVLDYEISTTSPVYESENGETAYWRFGDFAPGKNEKQRFYIDPVFPEKPDADQRNNFYRAFTLKTTVPWIKLNKSSTYIKGEKAAVVDLYFDKSRMKKPGIYSGKVLAFRKGSTSARDKEFELLCNVVKPIVFNEANGFSWKSGRLKIQPGNVRHIFFDIPFKATAATIRLKAVESEYANIRGYLYDPQGRETEHYLRLNSKSDKERLVRFNSGEMERGSYELDLYADFRSEEASYAEVSIVFSALEVKPSVIRKVRVKENGESSGSFSVLNHYDTKVNCRLGGALLGLQKIIYIDDDSENYQHSFYVSDDHKQVVFELETDKKVFNYFTDFAVNIKDYSGKALLADGLSYSRIKITFVPPKSGDYILELVPAFAGHEAKNWTAKLTESHYFFKPLSITGSAGNFYPRVKKKGRFNIDGALPVAPDGFYLFGEIYLDSRDINRFRTTIPIQLDTGIK